MRTLWKGAIRFGLVHVPIRVYPATESKGIRFRHLHRECKTPIRYVRWCPSCGREVAQEEIASGYEHQKGQFVVLEDEDFERLPAAEAKVIDILDFIDLAEIDPIYYDKTYYLEPGDGGGRPYALLRRAMLEMGRVAVGRVTIRTKQSLAAIRVFDRTLLVLETMYWPDEIRSYAGLGGLGPEPSFHENETRMADMLVGSLSATFNPAKYTDEYREALRQAIQAKVEGRQIYTYREPETAKVIDLMEALRASVEAAQAARGPAAGRAGDPGYVGPAGPRESYRPPREPGAPGGLC